MTKKIISALMAVVMLMSVSLTSFADGAKVVKTTAKTEESAQPKKKIIKKSGTTTEKEETATTKTTAAKKTVKTNKISSQRKTVKFNYGILKCPKNVTTDKVDKTAYDFILGEPGSGDSALVRVRVFDRETSLNEEIVDENGLMYGMYTGFLTVSYLNKPSKEVAKGLGSQKIRKEVVSLFNKALKVDNNGKAESYTDNKKMSGIKITYADDGMAENCTILHGENYDYVLYGVSDVKDKDTLNQLAAVLAKDLTEKAK